MESIKFIKSEYQFVQGIYNFTVIFTNSRHDGKLNAVLYVNSEVKRQIGYAYKRNGNKTTALEIIAKHRKEAKL